MHILSPIFQRLFTMIYIVSWICFHDKAVANLPQTSTSYLSICLSTFNFFERYLFFISHLNWNSGSLPRYWQSNCRHYLPTVRSRWIFHSVFFFPLLPHTIKGSVKDMKVILADQGGLSPWFFCFLHPTPQLWLLVVARMLLSLLIWLKASAHVSLKWQRHGIREWKLY